MAEPDPSEFETIDAAPEIKEGPGALAVVHLPPENPAKARPAKDEKGFLSLPVDGSPIWFQLDGEGLKHFKLFELYMLMGRNRSVAKLVKELGEIERTPTKGKKAEVLNAKSMTQMAWKHRWAQRAEAYDIHVFEESVQQKREEIAEYQGGLLTVLKTATLEMKGIMQEPDAKKRAQRFQSSKAYMMAFLGHGGLRVLLEGHKTLFGEKHLIDVKERTVDLKYSFIDLKE